MVRVALFLLLSLQAQAAEQAPPVLKASATVVFKRVNVPLLMVVYFADGRECTSRRPLPRGTEPCARAIRS